MSERSFDVPVEGGTLHGAVWGESGPVILCSHGITANHRTFVPLVEALGPGYRVVAVDHRGRGRSNRITGPWGMQAHAQDLLATLDHLGLPHADVVVGQSMGGFVAAVLAAEHPQRVKAVLLADGGLPLLDKIPWFLPAGLVVRMVIGPAMKRLDMTFASRQAYADFWRVHPALARDWSGALADYVDYDLEGTAPALHSSTRKEAVIGDTRSMMGNDQVARSLRALSMPVRLLRAPRGVMDGKPLYADRLVQRWAKLIGRFDSFTVPDVNHYTILMAPRGAQAAAHHVKDLLRAAP